MTVDVSTKLARFWSTYRVAVVIGAVSIFFIILSITLLLKSLQTSAPITFSHSPDEASGSGQAAGIVIDIAGAVVRPSVYTLPIGSRVEDAITAAGGLADDVDADRLAQAVNRAAKLSDGAKLYIPKMGDTTTSHNLNTPDFPDSPYLPDFVSINAASQQELEALPGIGPATAKKIIAGRPYTDLTELVSKKAMGQALFEKLKGTLTL